MVLRRETRSRRWVRLTASVVVAVTCFALPAGASAADGPQITGTPANGSVTNATSAEFEFSISMTGITENYGPSCYIDGNAQDTCDSPTIINDLSEGVHSFGVEYTYGYTWPLCVLPGEPCTDIPEIGVTDRTTIQFTIDRTAPTIALSDGPDEGASLQSSTVIYGLSTDADSTMTCSLDGAPATACSVAFYGEGLADGPHALLVTATDHAGNTTSLTRNFVITSAAVEIAPPPAVSKTPRTVCKKIRLRRHGKVVKTRHNKPRYTRVCKKI